MENFVTKNQEDLIKELTRIKWKYKQKHEQKIGVSQQFIRENIEGFEKAISIVDESLRKLREM
jgi:predicted nucleotidyltransferase